MEQTKVCPKSKTPGAPPAQGHVRSSRSHGKAQRPNSGFWGNPLQESDPDRAENCPAEAERGREEPFWAWHIVCSAGFGVFWVVSWAEAAVPTPAGICAPLCKEEFIQSAPKKLKTDQNQTTEPANISHFCFLGLIWLAHLKKMIFHPKILY